MKAVKVLLFVISVAVLLFLIMYADPAKFLGIVRGASLPLIVLGLLVSTISISLRTVRWWFILPRAKLKPLFPVQMLGMALSNFTPGKVAEPAKTILLKIRSGMDVSVSLPSIIWERVMDVVVLLILSAFAFAILPLQGNLLLFSFFGAAVFTGLVTIAFGVLYSRRFGMLVFRFLRKFPFLSRISDSFILTFYEGKFQNLKLAASFVATLAAWILDGVVIWLALGAIGISIDLAIIPGILALATLIGIASMLPGGIGGTEVVMAVLLGVSGIEASLAITGSILARFMTFWLNQFLGGISLVYLSRSIEVANAIKSITK